MAKIKSVDIEVELTDNIDELKKYEAEVIKKALTEVGMEAQARVVEITPVDTGRLHNSIMFAVSGGVAMTNMKDGKRVGLSTHPDYNGTFGEASEQYVLIGTNVEYALRVEQDDNAKHEKGTQAHYMRDGISKNLDEYKRIFREVLSEG